MAGARALLSSKGIGEERFGGSAWAGELIEACPPRTISFMTLAILCAINFMWASIL